MRLTLIGVFVLAGATMPLFGQTTFGEITGVVTDASGAVVSGATVTVTNPDTNLTRSTVTNASGNYNFPSLLPGMYNVKAEMSGFQTAVSTGIELQVQQTARVDFKLSVGEMTQTVEVAGAAPLVNTEDAAVGTVIGTQSIVDLPLNGRDFLQLVALSPNVTATFNVNGGSANGAATSRLGGQRANESFAVSGVRREFNNYTLDGLSDTEVNYNAYIFLPSIDALQEFKVQSGAYSPEFGRGVGQITASTKSGTNDYHGVLFEFFRNNSVDARQFAFTAVVPPVLPFHWNNYGFTLAGPLSIPKVFNGKNKLFFMTNYEGFREFQQLEQTYTTIPQAMRNGDFSQLLPNTVILDTASGSSPATRTAFPGNIIPTSRLNPISVALLAYDPLPNVPNAGLANNFLNLQDNTVYKDQFTGRVDWAQSAKSTWFSRYSWQADGGVTPSIYLDGYNLQVHVDQGMIANTRILSPNVVNDFRFGVDWFHNENEYQTTNNPQYDVVDQLGLQIGAGWTPFDYGIPQVGIANGYSQFGTPTEGPYDFKDVTLDWNDGVSWTHGKHAFKFGVDIRRDRFNTFGNAFARGSFSIGNQATGYGAADFMLGYLSSDLKSVEENNAEMRATSQAYYANDTWKIKSNLTVDIGLRYEFTPPWNFRNNQEANWAIPYIAYDLGSAAVEPHPTICRVSTAPSFYDNDILRFNPNINTALGCLGNRLIEADYTNFAPRVGIAYSPGKWVFRAGGGRFYAQDIGQAYYDITRNLAGRINPTASSVTDNVTWQNPYLLNGNNPCNVSPPQVCVSTPGPLAAQYQRRTPYVEQWTASVQRQLTESMVFEVDYLGSGGHFLQRFHNINEPVPGNPNTSSALSRMPWPEIGSIQYVDGDGVATYESLVTKLTRRLSKGLNLLSAFTWARAIDDVPEIRAEGADSGEQNDACINPCERGLSQFNQKYRWVTSTVYDVPVGKGRAFMNRGGLADAVAGGWRLTSIITYGSGFPFGISTGTNRSGVGTDRPNAVPGQSLSISNPSPAEWFNIDAFQENALGQFGDVGRNTGIGPGIFTWDLSATKDFRFTEKRYLEFRFECFNCSNHTNLSEPSGSLTSDQLNPNTLQPIPGTGVFGTITSLRAGIYNRQLQFALKLYF
jgi:Carboxypeptidase regulatory-like domain